MIFGFFFLAPMGVAAVLEYLCCRLPKRRWWRWLPPGAALGLTLLGIVYRSHEWGEGVPLETLLLFPGLPAAGIALGLWLGWRLWRRLWDPRVIKGKK